MEVVWNGRGALPLPTGAADPSQYWRTRGSIMDAAPSKHRNGKELPSPKELRSGGIVPAQTWGSVIQPCSCGRKKGKGRDRCWGCLTNDKRTKRTRKWRTTNAS